MWKKKQEEERNSTFSQVHILYLYERFNDTITLQFEVTGKKRFIQQAHKTLFQHCIVSAAKTLAVSALFDTLACFCVRTVS